MKKQYQKGFTVIEVLIAATIITMILVALVAVGRTALNGSETTLKRSQATYLAAEGLELVRQMRDTNWTDQNNLTAWNTWKLVAGSAHLQPITAGDYALNYNTDLNRWALIPLVTKESKTIGNQSFQRKITIDSASWLPADIQPAANALKVTVVVTWDDFGLTKNIEASEVLTNWRPNF